MRVILICFFFGLWASVIFFLRVLFVLKLLGFLVFFFFFFSFPNVELSQDILMLSSQDTSLQVATEYYLCKNSIAFVICVF